MDFDDKVAMIEATATRLLEHLDSVQILASYYDHEAGETRQVVIGKGNWHARYGQMIAYIRREDCQSDILTRREAEPDGD